MRLYMKQKVFSFRDKFTVKDELGNDRYYVEGEMFSWGHKLHVYDVNHTEVAFLQQKLWVWLPRFIIYINGQAVAQVVKDFTFFRPSYHLEGLPWSMQGNFWSREYSLTDNGQPIMYMCKEWFTWGDSYAMEIANPENELICLCVALAVDCVMEAANNNNNINNGFNG